MQIGMIGLGRMGANMALRLLAAGHDVRAFDPDAAASAGARANGIGTTESLPELVAALAAPRSLWVMVPDQRVDAVIADLAPLLERGDLIVDGGNSWFPEDARRARELAPKGIEYLDVGTSGGVWGRQRGFCLMIGGNAEAVARLQPVFAALAPGRGGAPATPGRATAHGTADQGWLHCGGHGAGHFVKMIHNGIEYGMMAAYAEGFAMLRKAADEGSASGLETPLTAGPGEVAELWRRGSVVGSWLLDLAAAGMLADPDLAGFSGHVSDSGEGRWTVKAATDMGIPAHVLTAALYSRFASRGEADYANRVLSALRKAFGGHTEHG
ncbi:MAG TPA: decarboxylating 6-phosphogluconate dehydrogenase [Xanthomonadales bacterium]|nr:decarboxylating 6-phosphogluconate dehydrogenase [Xanthomonadales bacterium]